MNAKAQAEKPEPRKLKPILSRIRKPGLQKHKQKNRATKAQAELEKQGE